MEAATAADFTQASEIAGRYIALGSRVMISKGYVSGLTALPRDSSDQSKPYTAIGESLGPRCRKNACSCVILGQPRPFPWLQGSIGLPKLDGVPLAALPSAS